MTPVQKTLWYIESRFRDEFSLTDVAQASGVSKHYLIRAFGKCTGMSVMQYVRRRRLSEAAKALAGGAPEIISVAMMAGYYSHEAFTRAFRDEFGHSPSQVRKMQQLSSFSILEPIMLDLERDIPFDPCIEHRQSFEVSGLSHRYDKQSKAAIPGLWHHLDQHLGRSNGQLGIPAYGVSWNFDEMGGFEYLCGVNASAISEMLEPETKISIPAGIYAEFRHLGHISGIRETWSAIYNHWLPNSGYQLSNSLEFEHYSSDFDPVGGRGFVSLHIPLSKS